MPQGKRVTSRWACDNAAVTQSEFLERFDAHIAETRVINAQIREEMQLSREQHADLRDFTRDLNRRSEIVLGELAAEIREMTASQREMNEEIRENRAETRAQTEAVLSLLDRFS